MITTPSLINMLGCSEKVMRDHCQRYGFQFEVINRDGTDYAMECDMRWDRVRARIISGYVSSAHIG